MRNVLPEERHHTIFIVGHGVFLINNRPFAATGHMVQNAAKLEGKRM